MKKTKRQVLKLMWEMPIHRKNQFAKNKKAQSKTD